MICNISYVPEGELIIRSRKNKNKNLIIQSLTVQVFFGVSDEGGF
jgi:hypothetical protein